MKKTLVTLAAVSVLGISPLAAATPNEKRLTIEQRIQDTDMAVALKHYEAVRTELLNARLKLELAGAEQAGTAAERDNQLKMLVHKIEILERYAKTLKDGLLKAGQFASVSTSN